LWPFQRVVVFDFEYFHPLGSRPSPRCLVLRELRSQTELRWWVDETPTQPPFPMDKSTLWVAYYSVGDMQCFKALGWPMPERLIDLYAEFRLRFNGLYPPHGWGLLSALKVFGLFRLEMEAKEAHRQRFINDGPWTPETKLEGLAYCALDVAGTADLFKSMAPGIHIAQGLHRGRYMRAAANTEWNGIPIDRDTYSLILRNKERIKLELIAESPVGRALYDNGHLSFALLNQYLFEKDIAWPRTKKDRLVTDTKVINEMARLYPGLKSWGQLASQLDSLDLLAWGIGEDSRNRTMISPFKIWTARNMPWNNEFVFGGNRAFRALVVPDPGTTLVNIDWAQQEVGIAAAFSGDVELLLAYLSGDPYVALAKRVGRLPDWVTSKEIDASAEFKRIRKHFKEAVLGTQYGMTKYGLARKLEISESAAEELLRAHRRTYSRFWKWSDAVVNHGMVHRELTTVFGWRLQIRCQASDPFFNAEADVWDDAGLDVQHREGRAKRKKRVRKYPTARSLRNFLMQANGSEMMRYAACLATERGIKVCASIHDAFLIEAPDRDVQDATTAMLDCMREASRAVLDGFELRADIDAGMSFSHPGNYPVTGQAKDLWERITTLARRLDNEGTNRPV
jgi:hypothetical protein